MRRMVAVVTPRLKYSTFNSVFSVYSVFKMKKLSAANIVFYPEKRNYGTYGNFGDILSIYIGDEFDDCWCQCFVERAVGIRVTGGLKQRKRCVAVF